MKVVGQGCGPPRPPSSGGKVSLDTLIRQSGVHRGLPLRVKPPAVPKDLLTIATCKVHNTGTVRQMSHLRSGTEGLIAWKEQHCSHRQSAACL